MPIPPATFKKIQAIRNFISSGGADGISEPGLHLLIHKLFQKPDKIVSDAETLDAILALAVDFEAYRGKGSQYGIREFYLRLSGLYYHAPIGPPEPEKRCEVSPAEVSSSPSSASAIPWFEKLGGYFFQRVQGPPVRSQRAGYLRRMAWGALGDLSTLARRPEHLAHAQKVAADSRAADEEREGAVMFMAEYWEKEDPDQATAELLWKLEENPPSRGFLVTVLQTQIDLGLNDEFGALFAVGEWDDAEE
jgi:hypothetical protein